MKTIKNSVRLIGHLGADPSIKTFDSGKKIANLSLATTDYTMVDGKKTAETHWHNLVLLGKIAEVAEKYLQKGKEIAVDGKLTNRSYTTKNGEKKYITEVLVSELALLGKA
jgi:single-strand DNA-binding protein